VKGFKRPLNKGGIFMKKLLSTILILSVFCASFVGIQPKALKATRYYYGLGTQTTSDGKWAYIIPNPQKQREAVIVHYNGTDTNVIIPETVNGKTVIGVGDLYDEYISNKFLTLFNDDLNVQTVTLPKTVRIIKDYSYGELGSDEEGWEVGFMTYTPIPNTIDFTPSLSKKSITDFYVDIENPYLSAEDGILYSNDKSTLFRFPAGKKTTEFTLPETVQTASLYAFANTQLKKVNFSNVTKVSPYLFYKANIETVTGLENISSLSEAAFYKSAIKDFPYMPKARIIYDYAFFNCDNLTNVNIPLRTDWVGKYSFFDCQNIETVDFGKLMLIGSYAFSGCSKMEEVHLPHTCDIISDSAMPENKDYTIKLNGFKAYIVKTGVQYNSLKPKPKALVDKYSTGDDVL
jgi:hypothetical protein